MISLHMIILNLQRVNVMNERVINESLDQSHFVLSFLIVSSTMSSWDNTCNISVAVYCHQQRLLSVYCLKTWITKYILLRVDFQTAELIILLFQIRLHHIESVIQALYILNVSLSDDIQYFWITAMLTLQKLKSEKMKVVSLKSIMKNKSTTFNNIKIIENIYTRQFNLKVNDFIFHYVLQLIYENLKTWSCICFVKKLRCNILKQSFNHFDWLLSELDLWHLHLNMLQLIHKIHWNDIESSDVSTLQYVTDKWHQAYVVQSNNFQTFEELIIHSY